MLKAVARARRWALELISEQVNSVDEIARREQMDKRSVRRSGAEPPRTVDPALLKAVSWGREWFDELASGRVRSLSSRLI